MPINYIQLDPAFHQIRLLDLQPGQRQDQISFRLRHVNIASPGPNQTKRLGASALQETLPPGWVAEETSQYHFRYIFEDSKEDTTWTHPDSKCDPVLWQACEELPGKSFEPNFEALSYTWDTEQNPEVAQVTYEQPFQGSGTLTTVRSTVTIRENLANALRALRYSDKGRTLWVDALCINQSDLPERSSQVRLMALLYKLAQRVVVWLGQSTFDTALAVESLQYLGSQLEVSRRQARYRAPDATEPDWFRASTPLPYDEATWQAIHRLLESKWFERLWIWQEIQLANSHAVVICGSHEINWQCFRKALISLYTKDHIPFSAIRPRLEVIQALTSEIHGSSAYLLLNISRRRLCSDPKDHIYGMLSLCGPLLASKIKPDYRQVVGPREVFRDFFAAYLLQVHRLDLLAGCDLSLLKTATLTWVPDWSADRNTYPLYGFMIASGVSKSSTSFVSSSALKVLGTRAGTVSTVSPPTPLSYDKILETWHEREPQDLLQRGYPGGGTLLDAYCATLRAGYFTERWPVHAGMSFTDWKSLYLHLRSSRPTTQAARTKEFENVDLYWCLKLIRGRVFFETADKYIGMGPPSTQPGDVVAVLLGCKVPMVLRPTSGCKVAGEIFKVVGECYVHGIDDASSLLGSLPQDWRIEFGKVTSGFAAQHKYRNLRTNQVTDDDPRLPSLSNEWCRVDRARSPDDPALCRFFRNSNTDEEINYDPRMGEAELRKLGVIFEDFILE